MARFVGAVLVLLALALASCGGDSEAELEKAEKQYIALNAKWSAIEAEEKPISDAALKAAVTVADLFAKRLEAAADGNEDEARELDAKRNAVEARRDRLRRRAAPFFYRARALFKRLEVLRGRIESLKGCDKSCRASRDRAAELGTECVESMIDADVDIDRAGQVCRKRYPIPGRTFSMV